MPGPTPPKSPKLPPIPSKHYFTIGEVSSLCEVKAHVLRYWEQEFDQLKPVKRRGNRRYYQPHEVQLIRDIRGLLYDQGFTISGARAILDSKQVRSKLADAPWTDPEGVQDLEGMAHNEVTDPSLKLTQTDTTSDRTIQQRISQNIMVGMISGAPHHSPDIHSFDLAALKHELHSILDILKTD
jgi:DNA-binding transcriptional MerR regulator